jgi:hypothetical protein
MKHGAPTAAFIRAARVSRSAATQGALPDIAASDASEGSGANEPSEVSDVRATKRGARPAGLRARSAVTG